jgi:hypothetical protein
MKKIIPVVLLLILLFSSNGFSQTQNGEFVKDSKSGCLVWNDIDAAMTVTWNGNCKDGYAEGSGTLTWFDNNNIAATYVGEMQKGYITGKGKYIYEGWGSAEGNFVNGTLQGQGKVLMLSGGKLEGNFVDGELLDLDAFYLSKLKKIDLGIEDTQEIYRGNGTLFYYALAPQIVNGVLVLMPSTGEGTENVISCNKRLMQLCYDNNILSVVLSTNYNKGIEADTAAMNFLNSSFKDIIERYKAPADKFILSGLSLGGENAIQYTEISRSEKLYTSVKPLACIGVDPPVDMANLYERAKEEIALYTRDSTKLTDSKKAALNEDYFLIDYFEKLYGGSPKEVPERYVEGSQYTLNHPDGGNAKYLIDVPIRIYTDPDISWQMKNKSRDYYHMNCTDQSAMINFLQISGNTRAEFIPALGKGYRLDGLRHPHSWSIVDADECVQWILSLIK